MKQKGFSVILILVGIFIISGVIISGAYYLGTLKSKPQNPMVTSQTPQPTPDETANWKTYISTWGNFKFKYPNEWRIVEEREESYSMTLDNQKDQTSIESVSISISTGIYNITEEEFTNPQSWYWLNRTGAAKASPIKATPLEIGGKKAMKWDPEHYDPTLKNYPRRVSTNYEIWLGGSNKRGMSISLIYAEANPKSREVLNIFDKILSTFKFTDQNQGVDTSNWKTYTNKQHNFSLKYPPIFNLDSEDWGHTNVINTGTSVGGVNFVHDIIANNNITDRMTLNVSAVSTSLSMNGVAKVYCGGDFGDRFSLCTLVDKPTIPDSLQYFDNAHYRSINTIIAHDNLLFEIELSDNNPERPFTKDEVDIYNQILSTFKFTN